MNPCCMGGDVLVAQGREGPVDGGGDDIDASVGEIERSGVRRGAGGGRMGVVVVTSGCEDEQGMVKGAGYVGAVDVCEVGLAEEVDEHFACLRPSRVG